MSQEEDSDWGSDDEEIVPSGSDEEYDNNASDDNEAYRSIDDDEEDEDEDGLPALDPNEVKALVDATEKFLESDDEKENREVVSERDFIVGGKRKIDLDIGYDSIDDELELPSKKKKKRSTIVID